MQFTYTQDVHPLASKGTIAFHAGNLISVADDSVLKVHKIRNNKLIEQAHIELPAEEHEPMAVCSNQIDLLMIGGKNKAVNLYKINDEKITQETFQNPELGLRFQTEVTKIQFAKLNWVLGFSNDSHMSIFNTQTQKTIHLKPGHNDCSVKSGMIDSDGKYAATTGSDGHLNIYKLNEAQDAVEFITKFKITDRRVTADVDLRFEILDDGETILIPGQKHLVFVQLDEDTNEWTKIEEPRINHNHEITSLLSISNEVLLSYSAQDQMVKIWRLGDDLCECFKQFTLANKATSIKYDPVSKCLAVMDDKCHIGIYQFDFEKGKEVSA